MLAATLEKRIKNLERRSTRKSFPSVHEAETVPPVGVGATFVDTHPGGFQVFVAPLRLHGYLQVFRASAVIRSNVQDGTPVQAGMAIYKYSTSPYEVTDPIKGSEPYSLRLVAKFGVITHTETAETATQVPSRFNSDLVRSVVLDPRSGVFFVAYQTNAYGSWLCPGYSVGDRARRKGRKTGHVGASADDFPDNLTVNAQAAPVPWIALRSSLGVRLYGDVETHG